MKNEITQQKIIALASFLKEDADTITESRYDATVFEIGNREYMVLTDEEADEKAREYIQETLWAFNASFLADQTDLPIEVFEAIQANNKCESNNPALERIIEKTCGIKAFAEAAISADGRGHFLNNYDGNEDEIRQGEETFFIYRRN